MENPFNNFLLSEKPSLEVALSSELPIHRNLSQTNLVKLLRHSFVDKQFSLSSSNSVDENEESRMKICRFDKMSNTGRIEKLAKLYATSNSSVFVDKIEQLISNGIGCDPKVVLTTNSELIECTAGWSLIQI
jgi:hypothetical protein